MVTTLCQTVRKNLNGFYSKKGLLALAFCYKINKEYALKELNFKNAKSKIKKDEEEAGHGDIYKRYLAMNKNEELVKQFENSKTTVALENYNALTT